MRKAVEHANRLLDYGEIQAALPLYNRIIAENSTAAAAYIGRAKLKLELGKTDEALKDLNLAVKYDTNMSNKAIKVRGDLLQGLHRYEEAAKDYSFILAAGPASDASQERGNCYLHLNRPQLAINDYTDALKRKSGRRKHILTGRGNAYLMIKDYQKALQDYDTVLKEDPDANRSEDGYMHIHEAKSEIYKHMGKLDLARREAEKALSAKRELMDLAPFTSEKGKIK